MTGTGNDVQIRVISEQIAEAAVRKYALENPPPVTKPEIPAPLKWIGAIASAVITAGVVACCIWVVSSLSALQQTVTRIDERQLLSGPEVTKRLDKMDERLTRLEHTRDTSR